MQFRPSAWKKRSRNSDKVNHQKADARVPAFFRGGKIRFFTESWGANKDLGEAPKSCTRKEHESATDSIARRGQGAIAPCRVKGQRPLWGLGQRPNSSTGDQYAKRTQQRCRQRSVPASNFARPQTRPQAALPQRFREEQQKTVQPETAPSSEGKVGEITPWRPSWRASSLRGTPRRSR